jgi:integrase
MRKIHVSVVVYQGCRNLVLRYKDPVTGKYVSSTTYRDPATGEETKTGENRKAARKLANLWEADLNSGRDQGRHATSWQQFRLRYEDEVIPGLATRTAAKISTIFNAIERILPKVAAGRLADLNAEAISRFQAELRDGKRSENTLAGYLAHLRAALQWAADQGMIPAVPKIKRPQRAKKGGRGRKGKGRPITAEELDRLVEKIPAALADWRRLRRAAERKARRNKHQAVRNTSADSIPVEVNPAAVQSWRHYLRGLWLSGLRLAESIQLYWDRPDRLCIELRSRRPMLRIPAECEKGHRDRLLPITPDFAVFLLETPEAARHGRVFRPMMPSGNLASDEQAGRMVSLIGELARVVVHADARTGNVKYASAHDLRRSFGNRWAKRIMPAVLQKLMRHESIETTMGYYVDLDADELAEDLYRADEKRQESIVAGSEAEPVAREGDSIPDAKRVVRSAW